MFRYTRGFIFPRHHKTWQENDPAKLTEWRSFLQKLFLVICDLVFSDMRSRQPLFSEQHISRNQEATTLRRSSEAVRCNLRLLIQQHSDRREVAFLRLPLGDAPLSVSHKRLVFLRERDQIGVGIFLRLFPRNALLSVLLDLPQS